MPLTSNALNADVGAQKAVGDYDGIARETEVVGEEATDDDAASE
jgi:hypothetical protein